MGHCDIERSRDPLHPRHGVPVASTAPRTCHRGARPHGYLKTDGIIGEVATLLARAAVHAIRTGAERIDRHVVDAPVAISH